MLIVINMVYGKQLLNKMINNNLKNQFIKNRYDFKNFYINPVSLTKETGFISVKVYLFYVIIKVIVILREWNMKKKTRNIVKRLNIWCNFQNIYEVIDLILLICVKFG